MLRPWYDYMKEKFVTSRRVDEVFMQTLLALCWASYLFFIIMESNCLQYKAHSMIYIVVKHKY